MGLHFDKLISSIKNLNMNFGLWVEPEMVSYDSLLYKQHPDWCIEVKNRPKSLSRNQLILNLGRPDVQEMIIEVISNLLKQYDISYIKWDMNRAFSEIGSSYLEPFEQNETSHRYMLGLYRVIDHLTTEFESVLFENCASGGGRFDLGLSYYMPQTWISDDTDPIERLKIQMGGSILFPTSVMSCHLSSSPNHITGRVTPMQTRAIVAMFGQYGFEINLDSTTQNEKQILKDSVLLYKSIKHIILSGDLYRLSSPFENNESAFCSVSKDKTEVVVSYINILSKPNHLAGFLKVVGVDEDKSYKIMNIFCSKDSFKEYYSEISPISGSILKNNGLPIPLKMNDFDSILWYLKEV